MKQKTKKSVAKKVKISKNGKVLRRATGQNHYNSRATGNETRSKRLDTPASKTDAKNILHALPYA